jgi:hypothetical protein
MNAEDAAHEDPELPESRLEFRGPYESHDVVFKGRQVPFLRADLLDGGRIDLTLDRRFGLVLSTAEAERFVPFLAHAIAVARGYTCHPSAEKEPNSRDPFPRVRPLLLDED